MTKKYDLNLSQGAFIVSTGITVTDDDLKRAIDESKSFLECKNKGESVERKIIDMFKD